jgi:urocanate hydratase
VVDTGFRGAPHGLELRCRGWEQEGALRCLLNNLDPDVAEDAAALVVYGGRGRAARSPEALADIVTALERLGPEETLIVQSGKAVAVLPTHPDAPRVLISTAMIVPAWSDEESFRSLEDAGLTMYGQMTAAGWFYIGTQGILGFTYETFRAVGAAHFGGTLAGKRVLTAGLGGMGGAQGFAVTRNGGRALVVEVDPLRADRRARDGWVDLVAGYDDALAAHLDPEGPGTVALVGNAADVVPRFLADGVDFDVVTDQTAAHDPLRGYVPRGFSAERAGEADPDDPAFRSAVFDSLAAHVEAMLGFRGRGSVVFEYGNGMARDLVVLEALPELRGNCRRGGRGRSRPIPRSRARARSCSRARATGSPRRRSGRRARRGPSSRTARLRPSVRQARG